MKNTHAGKLITQILSVVLCVVTLIMLCCTFHPYFSITKAYHFILNPNPETDYYTLVDVMWCNTKPQEDGKMTVGTDFSVKIIREYFESLYDQFDFNKYVTNIMLNFVFAIATVVTALWFAANEFRRFPSMISAIFAHICGFACGLCGLLGYGDNAMLNLAVPEFLYIKSLMLILSIVALAIVAVRFVIWLLTTLQLRKERKARLALL
jgi:hypothetical protein